MAEENILNTRKSGVLFHISSLPSKTGIGTLGAEAFAFIDWLKKYGQTYWQVLPVGPTGYGDSPYQSFSTFAGNPYFIDPETLAEEGYLDRADFEGENWGDNPRYVDFGLMYQNRQKLFAKLHENFKKNVPADYADFCKENKDWLDDYALFMAVKDAHGGAAFVSWEADIRQKQKDAAKAWTKKCADRIEYYKMLQYFFFRQWNALRAYANKNGVKLIGDIPIYVAADSSDVWSFPEQFMLDENRQPIEVAGCPPDAFSADGQLWGNPVYNWEYQKKTHFAWWKKRLQKSLRLFDVIRIDHFRGFESYYCIPFGDKTARNGTWRKGPDAALFDSIKRSMGDLPIIAEDLGYLTPEVKALLSHVGFPGMKIVQFAFDSREESDYLPHRYIQNSVVYTGTHDNDTIEGWKTSAAASDVEYAVKYLRSSMDNLRFDMMIAALSSVSNTCITTMQDLIGLGSEARMNAPSSVGTNWKWRALREEISESAGEFLSYYTKLYCRQA